MLDSDCLFCKISNGDVSADIVLENNNVIAFRDINPQAPTHVLVVPRQHIATINDIRDRDDGITGKLISAIWDPWEELDRYKANLEDSDIYTLRRIVPSDRGLDW